MKWLLIVIAYSGYHHPQLIAEFETKEKCEIMISHIKEVQREGLRFTPVCVEK